MPTTTKMPAPQSPTAVAAELNQLVERIKNEIAERRTEDAQLQQTIELAQSQQSDIAAELERSETILSYLTDAVRFAVGGQVEQATQRVRAVTEVVRGAVPASVPTRQHAGAGRWSGAIWGRCKNCGTQRTPHAHQGYCAICWERPEVQKLAEEIKQLRRTRPQKVRSDNGDTRKELPVLR